MQSGSVANADRVRIRRASDAGVLVTGVPALAIGISAAGFPATGEIQDHLAAAISWTWRNLGLSLPVFGGVLALYAASLDRLRNALSRSASPDEVRQADQLSDVWISLFFGIGVIWTAIGMRGALVEALTGAGAGGVLTVPRRPRRRGSVRRRGPE